VKRDGRDRQRVNAAVCTPLPHTAARDQRR